MERNWRKKERKKKKDKRKGGRVGERGRASTRKKGNQSAKNNVLMSAYWPISFSLLYIRPSKPIFINILTALKGNTSVSPLNHCLPHYCYIFQYSIISISTQSYINSKTSIKGINNKWSSYRELNSRPLPYQGSALPLSYMSVC